MAENVVLDLARHHLQAYADTAAERARAQIDATERRATEELVRQGLNAYQWLRRAEETLREADYCGLASFTHENREAVAGLYKAWIDTCADAECLIGELERQGCPPENADRFRAACAEAREIVARQDWQLRATHARVLSGSQEPW